MTLLDTDQIIRFLRKIIAIISLGYADGFTNNLKNNSFKFKGRTLPIIGDICMDFAFIDITECEEAIKIGDYIEVYGNNKDVLEYSLNSQISVYELLFVGSYRTFYKYLY